ncbi:AHH domain-containing protein [Streptococcus cristatus]|uniref:Putative hemagglutinin-related protein n=1 Tax=Streptococcus cristatus TaxID=45634 RepID=A0A139N3D2_STRCR|nr:AHH domain-containing protein [Streptococcus cristatus]KXT70545.1 putative hemagglutinin-related protein [Streptococcus cristatus]
MGGGAELAVYIASNFYPIAKAGKLRKLEKALDAVDAVNDASKATKAADKASDAARVVDKVDDVKDANKVNKPLQMHHYATNKSKKYTAEFERIVQRYNLDLDEMWNKELLPHQGRHPNAYHEFVKDKLNFIDGVANGNQEIFLDLYEKEVRSIIRNNPDMLYSNYWKGLD